MKFISALLSSDDKAADSLIVGGLAALLVLFALVLWNVVVTKHEFGAMSFAGAAGTILAAIGGAKTVRDRFSPCPEEHREDH